ncbi:murein biosynthesis integral membrane protein MurJ [Chloroflexota bacterium]
MEENPDVKIEINANRQIARAAGQVMLAFVFSNLAGLVRQILVTNAFGTDADIEAFNAANRVAETLFNLVAGGALSSAFIPTFTGLLAKGKRKDAWKLASAIVNLALLILILLAILTAIFAPQVVRYILAPGFRYDAFKEPLTIELMRLMMSSAVVFGLSGLVMGILNSHQVFFIPALTPSMYQFGLIFGVVVLTPRIGIQGLAWGVILGSGLHLILQLPSLFRLKGQYILTFGVRNPHVWEVARLMGPRFVGVAVVQLNFLINTYLASYFVEGSVTGVVIAFSLMLMPQAAIAQSIAVAAMPTFSAQVALGKLSEMRSSLAKSLRGALLLSIPASFGLMLLGKPIVRLLYQRGEFDAFSTELVSWALLWYSAGLVGHAVVEILSRAFYSLHDTRTPVFIGVLAMSLNILLSLLFSSQFTRFGLMPHGGLALANSVATGVESIILVVLMRQRLNGIEGRYIFSGVLRALLAALVMGCGVWLWISLMVGRAAWIVVLGGVLLGGALFLVAVIVLRVEEVGTAVGYLRRRVGL